MAIVPFEYYIEGGLDWLRVVRRIKEAKDGSGVPRRRRLYLKSKWAVAKLPVEVTLYKDSEGNLFVDEEEVADYDIEGLFKT